MNETKTIRAAMSILGKRNTERQQAARRQNAAAARAAVNKQTKPCDCGQEPHKYTCPAYNRERVARQRAKKQA